jgi:hypothetical protein
MDEYGYIYIIYEREFRISGWPLYKIGRTQNPITRMNGYSKDSIMVYLHMCTNHVIAEKNLINIFKTKFIKHPKCGNEYFEGDLADMQSVINEYITKHHKMDGKLLTIKLSLTNNGTLHFYALYIYQVIYFFNKF